MKKIITFTFYFDVFLWLFAITEGCAVCKCFR